MKKNEDGEVFTYLGDKGTIIMFIDEKNYRKQEKALQKYCVMSYKNLVFETIPKIKKDNLPDGDYEYDLLTEKKFEKIYGKIKLRFFVKGSLVVIKSLEPSTFLIDMHSKELPTYKGIPYRNKKDLFKIKMLVGGANVKKKKYRKNN